MQGEGWESARWVESGHCEADHFTYSHIMTQQLPKSVGLGGDGDEIVAIDDVERAFGVKLDYADASSWFTAGDVFGSLQKALTAEERNSPESWERFAVALCSQTRVDPNTIGPDSPLLSRSRLWVHVADASAAVWIAAAASMLMLVAWTLL